MKHYYRDLIHKIRGNYNTKGSLILPLAFLCFSIISCGGAVSNNLPERSDTTDLAKAQPGADSLSQAGIPESQPGIVSDTARLGGTWFLVPALPSDTAAGKIPTIIFDESAKTFTGNTGCNNMRGKFSLTDSKLAIDEQIITTKMACPGYNEDAFLKSLPNANGYRFDNGMLVLLSDQTELSKWSRQPVKPAIKTT